ncbi:MAG: hypothetical protein WAQ24_02620 [Candidatus Saccharimonadales bacterium]
MDFRQTSSTPVSRPESTNVAAPAPHRTNKKVSVLSEKQQWLNWLSVVILFGVGALLALLAFSFARSNSNFSEAQYVNQDKYQAVFLNNGQVYFGKVGNLNSKYLELNKVYYLTQNTTGAANQQQASGDYTLVKLGCQQIHYPDDRMLINRDQVTFWENLNEKGKVAKSIAEFVKQNPNGPDCTQVSDQTQSSTNPTTQSATTPSNTTPTTKK